MSSNAVRFCVPGIQGKARPRMVVSGSGAHVFTPRKTKEYERRVAICYRLAGGTMHLKPVALKIAIGVFVQLLATKYPRTRAIHESVVEVVVEEEALDEQGR